MSLSISENEGGGGGVRKDKQNEEEDEEDEAHRPNIWGQKYCKKKNTAFHIFRVISLDMRAHMTTNMEDVKL